MELIGGKIFFQLPIQVIAVHSPLMAIFQEQVLTPSLYANLYCLHYLQIIYNCQPFLKLQKDTSPRFS